jgi:hypothetical protein
MNAMLKTALASINVPSILEPPGLFRTDGKRVDGVTACDSLEIRSPSGLGLHML